MKHVIAGFSTLKNAKTLKINIDQCNYVSKTNIEVEVWAVLYSYVCVCLQGHQGHPGTSSHMQAQSHLVMMQGQHPPGGQMSHPHQHLTQFQGHPVPGSQQTHTPHYHMTVYIPVT